MFVHIFKYLHNKKNDQQVYEHEYFFLNLILKGQYNTFYTFNGIFYSI